MLLYKLSKYSTQPRTIYQTTCQNYYRQSSLLCPNSVRNSKLFKDMYILAPTNLQKILKKCRLSKAITRINRKLLTACLGVGGNSRRTFSVSLITDVSTQIGEILA